MAQVLGQEVADQPIGVEGHTDNEPIKYSAWQDNWELSLARARAVVAYLVDEQGIDSDRLSASGFGKYRPIASNKTGDGRRQNRRVEIVVLPQGSTHGTEDAVGSTK